MHNSSNIKIEYFHKKYVLELHHKLETKIYLIVFMFYTIIYINFNENKVLK